MGTGASGISSGGTSGGNVSVVNGSSLVSVREDGKETEVDKTLKVMRDIETQYGVNIEDLQVVQLAKKNSRVMAFYDSTGNLAVNESYFDRETMNKAYDECIAQGFHPKRGNKSGLEAVVAHEMGHRLNHIAAGGDWSKLDMVAKDIVSRATRASGMKNATQKFVAKISGYAKRNYAEAVAEAFSDVYCNGKNAGKESQAIVKELNAYFGM